LSADSLSLDEARKEARKHLGSVARGGDPLGDRRRERAAAEAAQAGTLEAVVNEYLRRDGRKLRTVDERRAVFERAILPKLGKQPIADIRRSEITRLLDHIEDERGPAAAQKVLAFLSKLFSWHASRTDDFNSPIVRGMARFNARERARSRALTDPEIAAIWKATEAPGPFSSLVRFLLLTAARRNEAARATWNEINDGVWTIPAGRCKAKIDVEIPLSRAAIDVLAAIPVTKRDGPIFIASSGAKPISGFDHWKKNLDKASGATGWRLHDLRRTARSLMSRAGVAPDHAERCLGHVIAGVRGVYDRHRFESEKQAALEALAKEIAAIVGPSRKQ